MHLANERARASPNGSLNLSLVRPYCSAEPRRSILAGQCEPCLPTRFDPPASIAGTPGKCGAQLDLAISCVLHGSSSVYDRQLCDSPVAHPEFRSTQCRDVLGQAEFVAPPTRSSFTNKNTCAFTAAAQRAGIRFMHLAPVTRRVVRAMAAAALVVTLRADAHAHAVGENYVWVNVGRTRLEGRFEVRLADLRAKLNLKVPAEAEAAKGVIAATAATVERYLREHFILVAKGKELSLEFTKTDVLEAPKFGHFAQYYYRTTDFDVPDQIAIHNDLFFENDKLHRSILAIAFNHKTGEEYGEAFGAMIFSPLHSQQVFDLTDVRGLLDSFDFVWQGILHIWIGIDHVLFLIVLLLPAVLQRDHGRWAPAPSFGTALWHVVKIVSLFTVAHSITLSLAALDLVQVNSRVVESVIALSIIAAAMITVLVGKAATMWLAILFFGLFHGLGFASVMGQLPFRIPDLTSVILAFNLGVEMGQLAIIVVIFPLLYALRRSRFYVPVILAGGSAVISIVAAKWFVERAFELPI